MRRLFSLCLMGSLLLAQDLQRRPLPVPARSGWGMIPLDAEAQRQRRSLWLSDAEGHPVPFLELNEGLRTTHPGPVPELKLGQDAKGRPSAAFRLPDHLEGLPGLQLEVSASDLPWIARVHLERPGPGGTWLLWDPEPRPHVWQWAGTDQLLRVPLPNEPGPWRLTLSPILGRLPRLTGLTFTNPKTPWDLRREERIPATLQKEASGSWRLTLPQGEDVRGLFIRLRPPAAVLRATLVEPAQDGKTPREAGRTLPHQGALWNLPALNSEGTRLTLLEPWQGGTVQLRLPEGAEPVSVEGICARGVLAFPAEAGKTYFLHQGGDPRQAPGSLAALSEGFDPKSAELLNLGVPQPDPQGHRAQNPDASPWERMRTLWPWVIGVATLGLLAMAWRLLKPVAPRP